MIEIYFYINNEIKIMRLTGDADGNLFWDKG